MKLRRKTLCLPNLCLNPFLTFLLFAVLLLPQISEFGSAFAAKTSQKAVSDTCLSVALSTVFSDGAITVASPPGEAVSFAVVLDLANNCGTTLRSGATITATVNTTCSDGTSTPQPAPPVSHSFPGPIVTSDKVDGNGQAYCIETSNGTPTISVLPASITIVVTANGTDINGTQLQAPPVDLPVTW